MELITERLVINKFTESDKELWWHIEKDFEVRKYIDQKTLSFSEAANYVSDIIESYAANGYGRYAVRDKTNLKLIGMCGFLLDEMGIDFGYRYCPTSWGKGIAYEAAKAVFYFGTKTLSLSPVVAGVHPKNHASERILKKLGFHFHSEVNFMDQKFLKYEFH